MKLNRKWLLLVALVLSVAMATTGTLAYLTDDDADVNTMTLGKVEIVQNESQRVVKDGEYVTDTIDGVTSYVLEEFKQDKPLLPIVGDPHATDGITASYDDTIVRMTQIGSYGSMQVFAGKNAVDKFVTVTNTGKTDAFVRTFVAIEIGDLQERSMIGASYHTAWTRTEIGTVEIDGNNYFVYEFNYPGAELSDGTYRHENGVLPAGDTTYPSLCQVYLSSKADNEHVEAIDGNGNGKLDILVLSQAIQADGFEGLAPEGQTDSEFALNEGFGEATEENVAEWFTGLTDDSDDKDIGSPGDKNDTNNPPYIPDESVTTLAELQAAAEAGDDILMLSDIEGEADIKAPYGNKTGVVQNGGIIDGGNHELTIEVYGDDYGILTYGGTIRNLTMTDGCRAIVLYSPVEDVILDNVHIAGDGVLYPINTAEHPTVDGIDLIVRNSSLGGWTSFAGIETASFTNTDFIEGGYGYGWPYETLVKPYVNTTFTDCDFITGYYIDLSALGADCKVTFENCTVNGTAITAETFGTKCDGTETLCVELPAGRTFEDCVIVK